MPRSLFAFVWQISRRQQIWLCVLTVVVSGLTMVPLELQRRIVDEAIHVGKPSYLIILSTIYLGVLLVQGGLKYWLNVYRGRLVETVTQFLRKNIYEGTEASAPATAKDSATETVQKGAVVSMVAAEAEELAGFVGDSISFPLLQGGTALSALGYLFWIEPEIAIFAAALYLPQLLVVPMGQRRINRWSAAHARIVRKMGDTIVHTESDKAGRQKYLRRFMRLVEGAFNTRIKIYRVKFFLTFFNNFLDAAAPLIVLSVGGWLVIQGRIEVSILVVFISGFQKVADPWDQLLTFYRTASNANVKYHLIADALPPMDSATPASADT
jgi:ABC-type multidrug transport system fused ATPase/permease subunit